MWTGLYISLFIKKVKEFVIEYFRGGSESGWG